MEAPMGGSGQSVIQNPFQGCLGSERLNQLRHHSLNSIGIVGHIGVEQSLNDNLQCQPHHLAMNVSFLTWSPRSNQALSILDHYFTVRADSLAMKAGLGQTTLPT